MSLRILLFPFFSSSLLFSSLLVVGHFEHQSWLIRVSLVRAIHHLMPRNLLILAFSHNRQNTVERKRWYSELRNAQQLNQAPRTWSPSLLRRVNPETPSTPSKLRYHSWIPLSQLLLSLFFKAYAAFSLSPVSHWYSKYFTPLLSRLILASEVHISNQSRPYFLDLHPSLSSWHPFTSPLHTSNFLFSHLFNGM